MPPQAKPHLLDRFETGFRFPGCALGAAVVLLVVAAGTAFAQTTVRVIRDGAVIWRPRFIVVAAIVKAGTVLEVVSREGDWYQVVLPPSQTPIREVGFIATSEVEPVAGGRTAETPVPPAGSRTVPADAQRAGPARAATSAGVRGFAQIGYRWFDAHQSFDAIFGRSGDAWFGVGGEVHSGRGLFVGGAVQRFQRTGERVFVVDGEVSKLGIADTITITPVSVTIGYRSPGEGTASYVGAGAGRYLYKEKSEFAEASENIDRPFTSYHVLGGLEWRTASWIATAFEVQYTHVPNALAGGLSQAFGEHNLGGVEVRVKFIVGK